MYSVAPLWALLAQETEVCGIRPRSPVFPHRKCIRVATRCRCLVTRPSGFEPETFGSVAFGGSAPECGGALYSGSSVGRSSVECGCSTWGTLPTCCPGAGVYRTIRNCRELGLPVLPAAVGVATSW